MSSLTLPQEIALRALASAAGVPVEKLDEDTDIFDLGLDSLDFWTILMDVEDAAGAEIPVEVLDGLAQMDSYLTVRQLLDILATWDPTSDPLRGM